MIVSPLWCINKIQKERTVYLLNIGYNSVKENFALSLHETQQINGHYWVQYEKNPKHGFYVLTSFVSMYNVRNIARKRVSTIIANLKQPFT